jgi:hypothetical protein
VHACEHVKLLCEQLEAVGHRPSEHDVEMRPQVRVRHLPRVLADRDFRRLEHSTIDR